MATRLEFQARLEALLGSENVFFQTAPRGVGSFPRIIYKRDKFSSRFADNIAYFSRQKYTVILVSQTPDPPMFYTLLAAGFSHASSYVAEQLQHDIFHITL